MNAVTTSDYYERKLADPSARIPIHEDDPQPGRYRAKNGERYAPVAIWKQDGAVIMLRDGQMVPPSEQSRLWTWCAQNPISPDAYERMASGEQASDPIYAALPDAPAQLLARIQAIGAMPSSPSTSDEAERLADAAHLLKTIEKRADDTEKELSAPLKAQLAEVAAPWKEVAGMAKAVRDPIMAGLAVFLCKKNEPAGVKGQLGKAISLRTDKTVEVFDLEAAISHFAKADPEAFRGVVEKLARAALKDGTAPGCRLIEKRRAQ